MKANRPLVESQVSESRRAILHIGTHKTGTTSFQAALHDNFDQLLDCGIRVFESRLTETRGWAHELPLLSVRPELTIPLRLMIPDSTLSTFQTEAYDHVRRQVLTPEPVLIASHEELSFIRRHEEVEFLAKLLNGRQIQVVIALREKNSFLRSYRNQLTQMGYPTSSPYQDSFMYTKEDSWIVDRTGLVGAFSDVLGSSSVSVIDYEATTLKYGSIVRALWSVTGLPDELSPSVDGYWLNVSEMR